MIHLVREAGGQREMGLVVGWVEPDALFQGQNSHILLFVLRLAARDGGLKKGSGSE